MNDPALFDPRTACAPSVAQVLDLLGSSRFDLATEATIQFGIDRLFAVELGPSGYRREVRLSPRDRVDFLVGEGIAVEVKHKRAAAAPTLRQLGRYAEHPEVFAIILATGWPMELPLLVGGKPVHQVGLGRAWL